MTNYWDISPFDSEEKRSFQKAWEFDVREGTIAVGWPYLGDLRKLTERQIMDGLTRHKDETGEKFQVGKDIAEIQRFLSIKPGDIIIARWGLNRMLAQGVVKQRADGDPNQAAYYDEAKGRERVGEGASTYYPNFINVEWTPDGRLFDSSDPKNRAFVQGTIFSHNETWYHHLLNERPYQPIEPFTHNELTTSQVEPPVGEVSRETFHSFHKSWLRGIFVPPGEAVAFSIRFKIGPGADYPNEWIKENEILSYSGQGRPEDGDQTWNKDNNGLRIAMEERKPIMVFETLPGNPTRHSYHGKWFVTDIQQKLIESTGQKILRFTISKHDNPYSSPVVSIEALDGEGAVDLGKPAARVSAITTRIIRDTEMSKKLKEAYLCKCQVCGKTLSIWGEPFAEAHHLRPLGGSHNGPDHRNNMLVLCPNDHARFDMLEIAIDPQDGRTIVDSEGKRERELTFIRGHSLDPEWIAYHYHRFEEKRATRRSNHN